MKQAYELMVDTSSVNSFASSYHKIQKVSKTLISNKQHLPPLDSFMFIEAKLNLKPILQHILQSSNNHSPVPIFTFQAWAKLKNEVRVIIKKYFHQKLKEINSGNLLVINPGESINVRTDYFCLSPHCVYTILIPLQKCQINSGAIGVSKNVKLQGESESELLDRLQNKQICWEYAILQQGDIVLIGRDCIYGSFRNDSNDTKYFLEMRWVKNESSSSSSNSS